MLKFVKGIMIMEKFAEKFTFIIVLSIIFFVICSLLVKLIKHDTWISFKLALVNGAFPLFVGITSGVCTAIFLCLARTN